MKKKYSWCFLAFLLPLLSAFIIYVLLDFYPFGNKSIYISDLYAQYRGFLMYAKEIMLGQESIQYSWNFFSGSNMMGNFAYYMGSLYNFILIFIPTEHFYVGIVMIIGLKLASISVTMFTFLDNSFKNKKEISLILALNFTFSGMIVGYFFNIIWLDTFVFLPLVINELFLSLKFKKLRKRYIVYLFLMIMSNFYMAYMVALFSIVFVISGFYNYYFSVKEIKKVLFKIIYFSIVALLMTGIIIVPMLYQLAEGIRNTVSSAETNFSFSMLIAKLFNGVYFNRSFIDNYKTVYPHIYSGILPLIVLPIFFTSGKIPKRERISYFVIMLLFICSFTMPSFANVWHGFASPTGFPYRFSFLFSFFVIFLCARGLECRIFEYKAVAFSSLFWTLILFTLLLSKELNFLTWFWNQTLIVSVFIFSMYKSSFKFKYSLAILVTLFTFIEVSAHQKSSLEKLDHVTPFINYNKDTKVEVSDFSKYKKYLEEVATPFEKVVSTYHTFETDNIYYGFSSVSGFSSMGNRRYLTMMNKLGYSSRSVRVMREGGTMITDILLGNQYRIEPIADGHHIRKPFELIDSGIESRLLKIKYENPIGLLFDHALVDYETPSDIQDRIIKTLGGDPAKYLKYFKIEHSTEYGIKRVNNEINQVEDYAFFSYQIPEVSDDELLYVYFPPKLVNNIDYIVDNKKEKVFEGWHRIDSVGDKELIITWNENQIMSDVSLYFMKIDSKKMTKLMDRQSNNGLEIKKMTNTSFESVLQVDDKTNLVLPLPFEKGWHFTVNSQPIDASVGFGGLILLENLPKNQIINISGEYKAPGFYLGIFSTISGFVLFIIIIVRKKWYFKFYER